MYYIKLNITLSLNQKWEEENFWIADVFKDSLISLGFDSFVDAESGFEAYCSQEKYSLDKVKDCAEENLGFVQGLEISYLEEKIEQKDWNAEWEKDYPSVVFGDFCVVRPEFNPKQEGIKYDIIINPKMSFGTAHHQTTSLIIDFISKENIAGKRVMDMGCGTGVFAILSMKMGAEYAKAIDIDIWAAENAKENAKKNFVEVDVLLGDASLLSENEKFDIFFANINRNILLADMQTYSNSIQEGGVLFLSGFYSQDVAILEAECKEFGLELTDVETKDNWAAMRLVKIQK
ncbi:MAG: 50S ribosomal protein L11 methyltransferase [Bacteroidales bacterium]|nr:50S ribosomal protein L11 methyltransferase [Bacteroidales bacterium]